MLIEVVSWWPCPLAALSVCGLRCKPLSRSITGGLKVHDYALTMIRYLGPQMHQLHPGHRQ